MKERQRPYDVDDVAKEMVHWWAKMSQESVFGGLFGQEKSKDPYLQVECQDCYSFGPRKLKVMLYFTQGTSLAINNSPMFKEDIIAAPSVSEDNNIVIDSEKFQKNFSRFGPSLTIGDDLDTEAWSYLNGHSLLMKDYNPHAILPKDKELIHQCAYLLRKERETRILNHLMPYEKTYQETLQQTYRNYAKGKPAASIDLNQLGFEFKRRLQMVDEFLKEKEDKPMEMSPKQEILPKDNVNHPSHYANQGSVECIDFIATVVNKYPGILAGDLQNVTKYTWRSHGKNGKEDIAKATWYFNHAEKTYLSLSEEAKGMILRSQETMKKILLPRGKSLQDAIDTRNKGIAEITKNMPPEEKDLYKKVLHGLDSFFDEKARREAKEALTEWVKAYDRFQPQKKQEIVLNVGQSKSQSKAYSK